MIRRQTALILFLLLLFWLLVSGVRRLSLTFDEPAHLASGYAWLTQGQRSLWTIDERGHPLLVDAWEALPLLVGNPHLQVTDLPGWAKDSHSFASAFINAIGPLAMSEFAGRIPSVLLTLLLAALVARWASDIHPLGLLIAPAVMVFDPNLLAHGRLATNDAGVTMLGTLGLFLAWRWGRHPSWPLASLAGIALGLTCLAKASGIIWTATALAWATWLSAERCHTSRCSHLGHVAAMAGAAFLAIWTFYGFSTGPLSGILQVPIPAADHWNAILFQTSSAEHRLAYAMGQLKMGGWWWYFPLAFILKNPLPFLLAAIACLGRIACCAALRRKLLLPLMFAGLYTALAMAKGPNIGYRHMLPIHPTLYLAIATVGANKLERFLSTPKPSQVHRLLCCAAVLLYIWYAAGTLRITPNEIAFFNELIGPPSNAHKYLISSNLDWGQQMRQMEDYLLEHRSDETYVAYAHPAPYPLTADHYLLPHPDGAPMSSPFHPKPGLYLIGATTLHVPLNCCTVGLDSFSYFRNVEPLTTIGNAILVYRMTAEGSPHWLVQCGTPDALLNAEVIREGFADPTHVRQTVIDCGTSWLFPGGGMAPGAYAIAATPEGRREQARVLDPFVQAMLAPARPSYQQPAGFVPPPFTLYEFGQLQLPEPSATGAIYPAPATSLPQALHAASPGPYSYAQGIEFLGVTLLPDPTGHSKLEAVTWWRVTGALPSRPFSIMAHLITSNGGLVGIADAFGMRPELLQPGDIFAQRHIFELAEGDSRSELWLRAGVYWLDDLTRWSLTDKPECDAVFVHLEK